MKKNITKLDEVRHIITNNCNLNCLHCYLKAGEENNQNTIINITEDILEKFYLKYQPNVVSATGGEPLLKKDIVKKIAKVINQYGGALEVVTNGILITEDFVDELQHINPHTFYQISLDGLEAYHNYLRNNKNAFQLALKAISLIVKKDIKLKVRLTATNENLKDIPKLINLLDSYNSSNISLVIRPVVSAGRAKENNLSFQKDYSILDEYDSTNIKIYTTDNEGKCGCGINTVAIDPVGNIYPCNYTVGNSKYLMGNIYDLNLSLYENEEFSNFTGKCYARHLQMFPNN